VQNLITEHRIILKWILKESFRGRVEMGVGDVDRVQLAQTGEQ